MFMQMMRNDTTIPGFFPATAMPDSDWWQALWFLPQKTLADLGVQSSMMAVDLCCGDGLFTAPLALMTHRLVALDIDPGMLALARSKVAAVGATNCDFVEADAYDIPQLISEPVDFVLMANTFHGVPDKPRLAQAVSQTLKPGGIFAIVNWHRRPKEETVILGKARGPKTEMRMEPSEVTTVVEPAGLILRRVVELPPYHYGVIFEKSD